MGRITTKKKFGKKSQLEEDKISLLSFTPISFILFIIALLGELYITVKYFGKDPYANYSLFLLILGLIALMGTFMMNNTILRFQYKFSENPILWSFFTVFLTFLLALLWVIAKVTVRYALSAIDLYFYYISTAIIEETFFRLFLCSLLKFQFKLPQIWVVLITSFFFMLIHIEAYSNQLYALVVMFIGGILFAVFYLFIKDITITMIAHTIVNIIAVGNFQMVVS